MRGRPLFLLLLAALLTASLAPRTGGQGGIDARIEGPSGLGPGQKILYNVTITGVSQNVSALYTVTAWLEGKDLTGAAPANKDNPFVGSDRQPRLRVNVTAPSKEGEITLFVRASAQLTANETLSVTQSKLITVLQPWNIRVPVHNGASVEVRNAVAYFYLDDRPIGNTTIPLIPPNGNANATLVYIPVGVGPGAHQLRVELDFNGDGRIEPQLGESILYQTVYKEAPPPNPLFIVLGVVVGVAAGLALVVVLRRRR